MESKIDKRYINMIRQIVRNNKFKNWLNITYRFDKGLFFHGVRVSYYSYLVGKELRLSDKKMKNLIIGSLFHDIGKIFIPKEIVFKEGKLTDEEYEIMRKHVIYGYKIANPPSSKPIFKKQVSQIILLHHEKYDGTGYPKGIKGKKTNLLVQIVHFADIYDALRSRRTYKPSFSKEKTSSIMKTTGKIEHSTKVLKSAKRANLIL